MIHVFYFHGSFIQRRSRIKNNKQDSEIKDALSTVTQEDFTIEPLVGEIIYWMDDWLQIIVQIFYCQVELIPSLCNCF